MMKKPMIETVKMQRLAIVIQYVFRANFNDTYWLEEKMIDLKTLNKDELTWFDPYNGKSNINDTLAAVAYCSDEKFIILEKRGETIKEIETKRPMECIFCEDYNESMMLAAHIRLK